MNILNSTIFLKNQLCNIFKWDFVAWWSPGPRDIKEAIGDMSEAVGDMGEANGAIKEATGDIRELIRDIREEAIGDMKEDKEATKELGDRQTDLSFRQESCHINDSGVFLG